ncbi:cytochrome c biogenesis CcdA family protein [Deinococcus yavapaiensis]|uniref:Cytochrome c biogenesis protein CcdA n=1 Tax=Deinococcus yavapaiensis KR-236 TaxID=694435 RepID=A0A318SAH9_9DEIO|nr:cytochrome c biogenesis CcdA family protein [Deinococcus yavapaiensis]PYE55879.1 cytochrome c biogenesis protein CcdA [Deinococcus yavapaiensis KR-236]
MSLVEAPPGLGLAFAAGLLSFLSPCVLPLVPSYLGVLGGGKSPILRALGFIAGFALVFVALGATASYLGALLAPNKIVLGRVGAVLIVLFGLMMLGVLRLPLLMRDTRRMESAQGYGAIALGAAFGFGWSPCLGPALGSILILASSNASLPQGVLLLTLYTLGLAVPFFIAALLWRSLNVRKITRLSPLFEKIGGVVLIVVGIMIFTGDFTRLASFFYAVMPQWLKL